jgi:hypothetical protein
MKTDELLLLPGSISVPDRPSVLNIYDVSQHTFLIGMKDILPEDLLWRRDHERIPAMVCFEEDHACDCPWQCIVKMAGRSMWLFSRFPLLRQILVLFKRSEKFIRRPKFVHLTSDGDVSNDYSDIPFEDVPRVWVLHIAHDFYNSRVPYRLFRANHNGLQLILRQAQQRKIDIDVNFWAGQV